jgi:hypothetical protein
VRLCLPFNFIFIAPVAGRIRLLGVGTFSCGDMRRLEYRQDNGGRGCDRWPSTVGQPFIRFALAASSAYSGQGQPQSVPGFDETMFYRLPVTTLSKDHSVRYPACGSYYILPLDRAPPYHYLDPTFTLRQSSCRSSAGHSSTEVGSLRI